MSTRTTMGDERFALDNERFALDNEAPITSVYEEIRGVHAWVTVRWRGKASGCLAVPVDELPALRDWLIPGGTDDDAVSVIDKELERADRSIKEEKEGLF